MRGEPPTLEELLAATRTFESRSVSARRQLRGRVASRLAAVGITFSAPVLAGEVALGAVKWLSIIKMKALIGLAVVGGATAGGALLLLPLLPNHPASGNQEATARPMRHLSQLPNTASFAPLQLPTPVIVSPAELIGHASKATNHPEQDALAEELALVRGAQSELSSGRATQGLALLDRYFRRFPSGILRPEAKVTRVRALCLAGRRAEAEREATRFAQTHPDSPLAGRPQTCKAP